MGQRAFLILNAASAPCRRPLQTIACRRTGPEQADNIAPWPRTARRDRSSAKDGLHVNIRWVHVPGNVVPSKDAYKSAISGQNILEDRCEEQRSAQNGCSRRSTCFAGKTCRNYGNKILGCEIIHLHLSLKMKRFAENMTRCGTTMFSFLPEAA